MRSDNRTLLTLEERLKLAAESRASSPEAAVKMVEKFSQLHASKIFCSYSDLKTMGEFIDKFIDDPSVDIESYKGFCIAFVLAIKNHLRSVTAKKRPTWGANATNALIMLGLMALDHAIGRARRSDKTVHHCLRMTLGQYLDAVEELSINQRKNPDKDWAECFNLWKDSALKDYDSSLPLADAMTAIMRRYIAAWREIDRTDYVIRCMTDLGYGMFYGSDAHSFLRFRSSLFAYSPNLANHKLPVTDEVKGDCKSYYINLAHEYPSETPDPAEAPLRNVLLPDRNYNPRVLNRIIETSLLPEMRELLEESISEERVTSALKEIDIVAADIFMLWVEPYLHMEK